MRTRLYVGAALVLMCALLVLVGCGGDDKKASSDAPAQTETATDQAASGIVAEAQTMLDEATQPLTFEPPGDAIDVASLSGKTVAIVVVDSRIPILSLANESIQEAAGAAGVKTTLFDSKSQVNRMLEGITRGINEADAIILNGIPIAAVTGALEEAAAKKIPTVAVLNNQPDPAAPGQGAGELVGATSSPNFETGGALSAAQAVVDTDGKANVVIFDTKEITPSPDVVRGLKSVLDKCSDCKIADENVTPLAEWATGLTPKAQSVIKANPDVNYFLPIFDGMVPFVAAGARQAGAGDKVKAASMNGTPATLQMIQAGDVLVSNPGSPVGWVGWHSLDQAMRLMLGQEPGNPEIPLRVLNKDNLDGVDAQDIDAPYGDPQYREGFKQLWGVG
jgi:ribose transport system substrate-binding protein